MRIPFLEGGIATGWRYPVKPRHLKGVFERRDQQVLAEGDFVFPGERQKSQRARVSIIAPGTLDSGQLALLPLKGPGYPTPPGNHFQVVLQFPSGDKAYYFIAPTKSGPVLTNRVGSFNARSGSFSFGLASGPPASHRMAKHMVKWVRKALGGVPLLPTNRVIHPRNIPSRMFFVPNAPVKP